MRMLVIGLLVLGLAGCARTTQLPQNKMVMMQDSTVISLAEVPDYEWATVVTSVAKSLPAGKKTASIVYGPEKMKNTIDRAEQIALAHTGVTGPLARRQGIVGQLDIVVVTERLVQQKAPKTTFSSYWFSNTAVADVYGESTESNLALQMADPHELAQAKPSGRPNPVAATGAVERYQKGEVRALRDQAIEAGKSSSD